MIFLPSVILAIENEDDRELIAGLYLQINRMMFKEALAIVDNGWQAEDIIHNSLVKVINKIEVLKKLEYPQQVRYIITTVKNESKNYIRDNLKELPVSIHEISEVPAADEKEVERYIIEKMTFEQFADCWEELEPKHRELLEKYYFLAMTTEELAKEYGVKQESVRMKLTRARRELLRVYEEKY